LRIEAYFQQWMRDIIEACPVVQSSSVSFDKRSTCEGHVRAELYFVDGSVLHVREYLDVETTVDRFMYVYQYVDPSGGLVFRYDNTGHHKKQSLATYPHHKYEGSDQNVLDSSAPNRETVLGEIEGWVPIE
jgi:Family of unknown function (DUF6516)